jgi:osmotically-inducible protein OsmY
MAVIGGVAAGTCLMYYLDPDRGRRRRKLLADQLIHLRYRTREQVGRAVADRANRLFGAAAETRSGIARWSAQQTVPDETLAQRIRSEMGHVVSRPHAVTVLVQDGCATLSGTLPAHEVPALLARARGVPGVTKVINEVQGAEHETGEAATPTSAASAASMSAPAA